MIDGRNLRIMSLQRYRTRRVEKDLGLSRLLFVERSQSATDDRDRVFALLGLATDVQTDEEGQGGGLLLRANYHLKVPEVYLDAASSIITTFNNLSILTAAGMSKARNYLLPTWVPDWSMTDFAKPLMSRVGEMNYAACNGQPANCKFDGPFLTVSGVFYDQISETGRTLGRSEHIPIFIEWILLSQGEVLREKKLYEKNLSAFRRTVIANRSFGDGPPEEYELLAFFEWFWRMLKAGGFDFPEAMFRSSNVGEEQAEFQYSWFTRLVYENCSNRCFFVTETGLMGIGPRIAAPGDMVCIVNGACVPLILREMKPGTQDEEVMSTGERKGKVLYIGDAYVDGLMNGEGYEEAKLRDFELQ